MNLYSVSNVSFEGNFQPSGKMYPITIIASTIWSVKFVFIARFTILENEKIMFYEIYISKKPEGNKTFCIVEIYINITFVIVI